MRKTKTCVLLSACIAVTAFGVLSFPKNVNAEENYVYGTMNIPYDEFYESENIGYDVDAVASATTSKWKNVNLTAGTYNQPNEDGTGTILGVNYYVALTEQTLALMGDNNYGFTAVENVPEAYKIVTIDGSDVNFSAVQGASSDMTGVTASISTDTPWGDYIIEVNKINNGNGTSDIGRIYGVILNASDGTGYALRHLENIWRDNLAWSNGFVTKEPHGNVLNYEDFEGLMGQTIESITYITDTGYHILSTSLYVPVKFESVLSVESAEAGNGSTAVSISGFPYDYVKSLSVEGMEASVSEDIVAYTNALPGEYTLRVSDTNGKYADVTTDFILSSDVIPAVYEEGKLVKSDNASEEDFVNFINNLSKVEVNGKEYSASGKKAVKIINNDGTVNLDAKSGESNIFTEMGKYSLTVTAMGYNNPVTFTVELGDKSNSVQESEAPKTGDAGAALPFAMMVISAAGAAIADGNKKK